MRTASSRRVWLFLLVPFAMVAAPAYATPQDQAAKPQGSQAAPAPSMEGDMAAMTEAYQKAAAPGAPHQRLARMAGHWTTTIKSWMAPGQPPVESTGTMDAEMILGGRYLEAVHKGAMMGMPFEGRELDGYDNTTGRYVTSWVDNMGTGVMSLVGEADASGNVLTMTGEIVDPLSHKRMTYKGVTTHVDDDTFHYESFMVQGGKELKVMDMVAKRAH